MNANFIKRLGFAAVLLLVIATCSNGNNGGTDGTTTLGSLFISPTNERIQLGEPQAFTVNALFSDFSTQDVTGQATWTATDTQGTGVATVDANGVAQSAAVGTASITASYKGKTISAVLKVVPIPLTGLQIVPSYVSAAKLTTASFTAMANLVDGTQADVTKQVTWKISDQSVQNVATIDATGLAQAQNAGTATVTAAYLGKSATAGLQVNDVPLTGIAIVPVIPMLGLNLNLQLDAIGTFADGTTQNLNSLVKWSAIDVMGTGVATIQGSGLLTTKAAGKTTVMATALGKTGSSTFTVLNTTLTSITVTPQNPSVQQGYGLQFKATATYSDNSTSDVTAYAAWSLTATGGSSPGYIDSSGLAYCYQIGKVTVTANFGGQKGTSTVTVMPFSNGDMAYSTIDMAGIDMAGKD